MTGVVEALERKSSMRLVLGQNGRDSGFRMAARKESSYIPVGGMMKPERLGFF